MSRREGYIKYGTFNYGAVEAVEAVGVSGWEPRVDRVVSAIRVWFIFDSVTLSV